MKKSFSSLFSIFEEFQKIPKGVLIDRPDELIKTNFVLNHSIINVLNMTDISVYFTRRTLKHVAEKGIQGKELLALICGTLTKPDYIFATDVKRRKIISSLIKRGSTYKHHVIIIESLAPDKLIIVTTFLAQHKYLKNFEILWRTATST